jgi:hypothetical protein
MAYDNPPTIVLESDNNLTSIGAESIAYILPVSGTGELPLTSPGGTTLSKPWVPFPALIEEKLDAEPKTGQVEDDRGRVIYSYSQPSKVTYSANIIQRDAKTFEFLRTYANQNFLMWVLVGQIGSYNQEILMYGKFGGNYSEPMSGDPKIPITFTCEVNPNDIVINKSSLLPPNHYVKIGTTPLNDDEVTEIVLKAKEMIKKIDTPITVSS